MPIYLEKPPQTPPPKKESNEYGIASEQVCAPELYYYIHKYIRHHEIYNI